MKRLLLILTTIFLASSAQAATWYVDNTATGANNGTSWTNAWSSISAIRGLSPGDTVYISGGASGKTYNGIPDWQPPSGSAGNPITFAVGQDAGHSGMVTISSSGSSGTNAFLLLNTPRHITINGQVNGQRRMTISNYAHLCYTQNTADKNVKILYIEVTNAVWFCYGGAYELAYSKLVAPLSANDDSFIAHLGDGGTPGFGKSSIHHNYIEVPRKKTQGQGFDALKWVSNVDIYNNTLRAVYNANYTGSQHGDGIQASGSYMRIYNNYFENFISYPILNEMYGSSAHWYIYNNTFKASESGVDWGAYQCIAIGFNPNSPGTVSNYLISNNTCVGDGQQNGIHFNYPNPAGGTVGAEVYIVNNLLYNSGSVLSSGAVVASNNIKGTTGITFVKNALYPNNDFRLTSAATAAISRGISPSYLTSVYTTDSAGVSRMLKSIWDIGAYCVSGSSGTGGTVAPDAPQGLRVF